MKVLLLKDLKPNGKKDDIIEVNDGYARNYLFPNKIATEATKAALNEHAQRMAKEERARQQEKEAALQALQALNGKMVDVAVRCGDGKLYGAVTAQDIANGLAKLGFEIDKKKITIKDSIKQLGIFDADVWLYKETVAHIKINVIAAE